MVEKLFKKYDNVVSIDRRPFMAFVGSAQLDLYHRRRRHQKIEPLAAEGSWPGLKNLAGDLRTRMVFLDDKIAMRLLGFATIMASGLMIFSLAIAWLIVRFGMT